MSDIVLDASVLVGLLDQNDSLHQRSTELLARMQRDGHRPVMLDVIVAEMVSALCRRAMQRKSSPPDLGRVRDQVHVHGPEHERQPRGFGDANDRPLLVCHVRHPNPHAPAPAPLKTERGP